MGSYGGFSKDDIRTKEKSKKFGRWFVLITFLIVILVIIMSDGNNTSGISILNGSRESNEIFAITTNEEISALQGEIFPFPVYVRNDTEGVIKITTITFDKDFSENFSIVSSTPKQINKMGEETFHYNLAIDSFDFGIIEFEISPSTQGKYSGEIEVCVDTGYCSSQTFNITTANFLYLGED